MSGTYALVQHSAFGWNGDPQFEAGLQSAAVTAAQARKVKAAGGVIGTYREVEDLAMALMYPDDVHGLIPGFRGSFATLTIDGLPVAIPVREIVA